MNTTTTNTRPMELISYSLGYFDTKDTSIEKPCLCPLYDCELACGEIVPAAVISRDNARQIADTLNALIRIRIDCCNGDSPESESLALHDTWAIIIAAAARALLIRQIEIESQP